MKTFINDSIHQVINYFRKTNWMLLLFLVAVLNVKLVVKIAAIILITLYRFRTISWKNIVRQRQLYFYFAVIGIGLINFVIQLKGTHTNYLFTVLFGTGLWILAAAASYHLFLIAEKEDKEKLYNTITLFFILHIGAVLLNLLRIMIKCGTFNPYTFKGLNQKYYISTGDHIPGITFDSPVTTALIGAFALLYFLYRRQFVLSLLAAVSMIVIGSNLTNIFLAVILLFVFIFHSDRIQKSMVIVQICLLIIFITKISPRDNEYIGRVIYNMLGKTYDWPKKNESIDFIKMQPDSVLDLSERKKKTAQLYIDSISGLKAEKKDALVTETNINPVVKKDTALVNNQFYEFREQGSITARKNRYHLFIDQNYPASQRDSLQRSFDWKKPGKWIAYMELFNFLKSHPSKIVLGAGIGNFSSRTAFKVTSLQMAGNYPQKFSYIHPLFRTNHLYLYLYYHSQEQMKHAAANTPDSTYSQLLGEYGVAGLLLFAGLYIRFFIRRFRYLTYGLPVLLLLIAAFSVEYWFEQLSVVILFEVLLFLDIRSNDPKFLKEQERNQS